MVTRNTQSRLRIRGGEMTYMDLDKYVPSMDMLDEYEPIQEWLCDYCNADQVYIGGGRMACANDKCENVLGKLGDGFEHMTGSYQDMYEYSHAELEDRMYQFDVNLNNIITRPIRVCADCGSDQLMFQAWVSQTFTREWDVDELIDVGYASCSNCNDEVGTITKADWKESLKHYPITRKGA